jgi:AraC-like DNA-binding protein
MPRLRQVRYSYPRELMQLAILMSERYEKREVSAALGVPASTHYRWLEIHRRNSLLECSKVYASRDSHVRELVNACEAHGFSVKDRVALLTCPQSGIGFADSAAQQKRAWRDNVVYLNSGIGAKTKDPVFSAMAVLTANNILNKLSDDVHKRLAAVRGKIDAEYFTELSCDEFGRIARMSKYNLINRFTTVFGVSPYRYLLTVRIQHAKKLLGSMQEPLSTIATAVGFDSQSSLCRAFKSVEGVSLSEFYRGLRVPSFARHRSHGAASCIQEQRRHVPSINPHHSRPAPHDQQENPLM